MGNRMIYLEVELGNSMKNIEYGQFKVQTHVKQPRDT
jgi:hypothetical protein